MGARTSGFARGISSETCYGLPVRSPGTAPEAVERYLARVRARAALFLAIRALIAGAGALSLVLAVGACVIGPVVSVGVVGGIWIAAGLGALTVAGFELRGVGRFAGGAAASLLAERGPDLVSPLRTSFELARAAPSGASAQLIDAHLASVNRRLAEFPPASVVPARWLWHPAVGAGLTAFVVALALVFGVDSARAGAWALMHPGVTDEEGVSLAVAFDRVEARLVYPAYLQRPPLTIPEPFRIEAPRGTTIELWAHPKLDALAAEIVTDGRSVAMEPGENQDGDDARWVGRFLAETDTTLALRLRTPGGRWVRDASRWSLLVAGDEAPRVALRRPEADLLIEGNESVPIVAQAADDHGIVRTELVIQTADGVEHRRSLGTFDPVQTEVTIVDALEVSELGVQPGDRVSFWVEARDGDDLNGPHTGRSVARTLTVASEATRRERALAELEAILDLALDTLATRLEMPVPTEGDELRSRLSAMVTAASAFLRGMSGYLEANEAEGGDHEERVLLGEVVSRVTRSLAREARAYGAPDARLATIRLGGSSERPPAPYRARAQIDEEIVSELESDTLLISDLLMRARIDDAAAIARELESLRREMASLLAELRRADTPEARAALMAALSRAQQRLADLRARMARLGTSVPPEYANAQETSAQETQEALSAMREAMERGDIDSAARALTRLEQEIDALAKALGGSSESFAQERFGARDRAMAEALDRLMGLEAEQRELARRSNEVRGAAARRALEREASSNGARRDEIVERSRAVRDALSPIDRRRLSGLERDALEAAEQRLMDAEDALSAGDLGEADQMVTSAGEQLRTLERDLELDSMMFGGHRGQTARNSHAAEEALQHLQQLETSMAELLPDLRDYLEMAERAQLGGDVTRQQAARQVAHDLAEQFSQGPNGNPLSPDASEVLDEIQRLMDEGARGLAQSDAASAAHNQMGAAQKLAELREQIEQDQQSGGGEGSAGSGNALDFSRPVHIHDADEFEGPMEMRRRLLDAMNEAPPAGFEDSVRRYYEGLLR